MNPSTSNLSALSDIDSLKKQMQSLAVLDLIVSPEWDGRYYSFNSKWSENEQMGSMRNGCGDEFFALFNDDGCFFKGFDHESAMSSWGTEGQKPWPGVLDSVPNEFMAAKNESAFSMENISFCFWRLYTDQSWSIGDISFPAEEDPDGSELLLQCLDRNPDTYREFAEEYFEIDVSISVIDYIYKHLPITEDIISELNSELSLSDISEELDEIGYSYEKNT
jgi:hypothetical protein